MPVNTFRMWFLGIFYAIVVSGLNQFFSMRCTSSFCSLVLATSTHRLLLDPSVYISGLVAQLTALPLGKLLEWVLPTYRFNTFGFVWTLNPGPFNIKEHTVITVMANVVVNGAYATDVIATQRVFYGQNYGTGYALLLCWSSQLIGYSYAGLLRRFLVWPNSMIWPGALVNAALFNTLHKNYGKRERKHMSRERFFVIAFACSFIWYWVPGYFFTALSVFNWVCWAAPKNVVVNQLFGTVSGLGMSVITLDWSMISFTTNPLVVPWWAQVNTMASFVLFFWIVTPIVYCKFPCYHPISCTDHSVFPLDKNVWWSKYLPMSSTDSYDNTGMSYDSSRILTNGYFDIEKYREYSPLFLSSTFAMSYGVSFAAFSAVIVHVFRTCI
jgi:OPT family small oligopeptide transporter